MRKNAVDNDDHACTYAQAAHLGACSPRQPAMHPLSTTTTVHLTNLDALTTPRAPSFRKNSVALSTRLSSRSQDGRLPTVLNTTRHPANSTSDSALQLPIPPPRHPPHHLHDHIRALRLPRHHRPQQGELLRQPYLESCASRRETEPVCESGVRSYGGKCWVFFLSR